MPNSFEYLDYSGLTHLKEKLDSEYGGGSGGGGSFSYAPVTIAASGWNGKTYSFENTYPSSGYDIVGLYPINGVTTEAMEEAWNSANCHGFSASNVITARGTTPTIDIVMEICVVPK